MDFDLCSVNVHAAGTLDGQTDLPVIVFVHGAAMDHTVWSYLRRYYQQQQRCVLALDLPGHGLSAGKPLPSVEQMADWVGQCADALKLDSIALVGHSMGALVALQCAANLGERVQQLALLGAAVPMAVSDLLLDEARKDSVIARDMMMLWGHGSRAHYGGNLVAGINIIKSATRLLEAAAPGVLFNDLNACNDYLNGMNAAAQIQAKTRLICGREDKMTPLKMAHELNTAISHSEMDVINNSGHIMMSEQPEATHQSLRQLLA